MAIFRAKREKFCDFRAFFREILAAPPIMGGAPPIHGGGMGGAPPPPSKVAERKTLQGPVFFLQVAQMLA